MNAEKVEKAEKYVQKNGSQKGGKSGKTCTQQKVIQLSIINVK